VLRNSVACIFTNISGLFHISELLFVEVVKIMHRPRTNRFLVLKFVPKTPVQSVPLWDTAESAGGTEGMVYMFVQFACCAGGCAMYADRCCVLVLFAAVWRFVPCCSDPRTLLSTDTVNIGRPAAAPSAEANRFNP